MKWSENQIAAALCRQVFQNKHLIVVPNCSWPGSECDLLVVTRDLRIIDVEIKISRSDFRADAKKEKWFEHWKGDWATPFEQRVREKRKWPHKVWKHYYAMPKDIWTDDLLDAMPSQASGVLLLSEPNQELAMRIIGRKEGSGLVVRVKKPAKPCRDADKLHAGDAIDIARLASLRMWDAYDKLRKMES